MPPIAQALDIWVRSAVPSIVALGFVLVGIVPWPLPGLTSVAPLFGLIAVHYWTVHRPAVMPVAAAFLLGVAHDVLGGGPVGLNALVLVATHAVISAQRRHLARRPFIVDWCGFAMVAAGAVALAWLAASLYLGQLLAAGPLIVQYLLTVFAYPAFAWLFARLGLVLFGKGFDAARV